MPWVTFDCFGTLVDWHSGFTAILQALVGDRTPRVLQAYHRFERELERETPHRLYKDVLAESLRRASAQIGVTLSDAQVRTLPGRWATLPVFADVEPMLATLRAQGYRLGVLTNCDDDLFAETERAFAAPFDLVVTAERVCDYKPSLTHFRRFQRLSGASLDTWTHVACSWFHDIDPARELGVHRVWLDRDRTGEDPSTASAHVHSASDVPAAVAARTGR